MVSKLLTFITGRLNPRISNLRTASINQAIKQEKRPDFYKYMGPSTLATLFSHRWPRFCSGDIYSRSKPLFLSFGEHTAVCGSLVCDRLWLVPATDRAFLWLYSAFGSKHTSDCSCGMWQPLSRVGNFAEYGNFAGG